MVITGRGRYAVTAMMDLALHGAERPLSLADLARQQGISLSYLEQIFAQLRRNGLVTGTRGRAGGYTLNRAPQRISIGEILRAVGIDDNAEPRITEQPESENIDSNSAPLATSHGLLAINARVYAMLDELDLAQSIALEKKRPRWRPGSRRQSGGPTIPPSTSPGVGTNKPTDA